MAASQAGRKWAQLKILINRKYLNSRAVQVRKIRKSMYENFLYMVEDEYIYEQKSFILIADFMNNPEAWHCASFDAGIGRIRAHAMKRSDGSADPLQYGTAWIISDGIFLEVFCFLHSLMHSRHLNKC